MSNKLAENLALAGIDDGTRAILRETWPLIRDSVPFALQNALASVATTSSASAEDDGSGQPTRSQLDAARERQVKHWEALFAANFDQEYADSVRQTAIIHAQVGLDPRWLVSGHLMTLTELHSLVVLTLASSMLTSGARKRLDEAIRAVSQAVLFDLQLCISAYFEQTTATARETLKQVAQRLAGPQGPAPAAIIPPPPSAEARRGSSELFVAAQRRTFRDGPAPTGAANGGNGSQPAGWPTKQDAPN